MRTSYTVAYGDDVLRVGTVRLPLEGYVVRDRGRVVAGWPHLAPGLRLLSATDPFNLPVVRAVLFAQHEPVLEDPDRALLTGHASIGLGDAAVLRRSELEGARRRCHLSVVEGPLAGSTDGIVSASAVLVASSPEGPAAGIAVDGPDAAALEAFTHDLATAFLD